MKGLYEDLRINVGKNTILSLSVFPMLGVGDYFHYQPDHNDEEEIEHMKERFSNQISNSQMLNDIIISKHPRYIGMTRNTRLRRGSKAEIKVPIYKDKNTNLTAPTKEEPFPGFIYMDSFSFGMGNCCFQLTVGCKDYNSALYEYDQLVPLTPIINAITASSSIFKGKLSSWDHRYNCNSQACDSRTEDEKDPKSQFHHHKSRYSSVYSYISSNTYIQDHHNDYHRFPINLSYKESLIKHGFSDRMAEHICNLFSKDPLIIFEDRIHIENPTDIDHFLNLQSTNWNALRFKPPLPTEKDDCFKIEVRSADLQLSAFENAAINVFIVLYSQIIMTYDINFIIPISLVDENFNNSVEMDFVKYGKFHWRTNSIRSSYRNSNLQKHNFIRNNENLPDGYTDPIEDRKKNIDMLSLLEILDGKGSYPGLLKVMYEYIDENYQPNETQALKNYLLFIRARAKGDLMTDAAYIRKFVLNHHDYQNDSIISEKIAYDLVNHLLKIQSGEIRPKDLFG